MTDSKRLASKVISSGSEPKVRHYLGMPSGVASASETRTRLPPASVLLIESTESGVFLYRYSAEGQFAGDTWHFTVDDAKAQAKSEYGSSVSAWKEVPTDINDIVNFMNSSQS